MKNTRLVLFALMTAGAFASGCANHPEQRPKILSSRSPAGALPQPPLGSKRPIRVPSAPVGQFTTAVTPQTVVGVPTPGQTLVPVQPGAQAPQNSQQFQQGASNGANQGSLGNGYTDPDSATDRLSPLESRPPQD